MKRAIIVASLLLIASLTSAQDVEVLIYQNITDQPLSEAVSEMVKIGSMIRPLEVTVSPTLREKRITVSLEHPIIGALQVMARAAGGHLWKLGEGKYAVRTKAPPPANVPPASETRSSLLGGDGEDEDEAADEEPAPPLPEWKQKIRKALEETPFTGSYERTHLRKILLDMAGQANVPLHLDPEIPRTWTRKKLMLDYAHPLEGDPCVDEVLTVFCGFQHIALDLRWGVVFVTNLERHISLPKTVFLDDLEELPEDLSQALDGNLVSCRLKNNSLKKAMETMAKEGKLALEVDAAAAKLYRKLRFTIEFRERRLVDALSILLIPEGLGLSVVEGRLIVKVRK